MFVSRKEIAELRAEVKKLRDEVEGFRIGPLRMGLMICGGWRDPRPVMPLRRAVELLIEHCGLEPKKIEGTPARVVLEKKKEDDPWFCYPVQNNDKKAGGREKKKKR